MKILVNASTIVVGGGIQNTFSFVREALNDDAGHEWHLALSESVASELQREFPEAAAKARIFANATTPARNRAARCRLQAIEAEIQPDCVFTYNGPAYVKFRAPHLLGFATPWVTHPSWLAYRTLSFPIEWIKTALASKYKAHWFRFADSWVTETNVSKSGLARRLGLDANQVFVVSNSCGPYYFAQQCERPFPRPGGVLRLLCFAAAYPHKRLELLPLVAQKLDLLCPGLNFEFVVTLPEDSPTLLAIRKNAAALGVSSRIKNEGRIGVTDGPQLYQSCDVCFMPTVLETFSATYPEAMAMGLPIVTSDVQFASDVCQDAALYFEANDAAAAAECIRRLITDEATWRGLIAKGKTVLSGLPTARQKYDAYMRILYDMVDCQSTAQPAASRA